MQGGSFCQLLGSSAWRSSCNKCCGVSWSSFRNTVGWALGSSVRNTVGWGTGTTTLAVETPGTVRFSREQRELSSASGIREMARLTGVLFDRNPPPTAVRRRFNQHSRHRLLLREPALVRRVLAAGNLYRRILYRR